MNGTMTTKVLAMATILLLVAFAAPATAQEEEFYYQRHISEQYTTESAAITSAAVTPQGSDWIVFALDTLGDDGKGLGLGVLYGHGNGQGEPDSATGSFMAPMGIIEYVDDGDGVYDLRGDDVVSLLPLHADLEDRGGFYEQTQESDDSMTWHPRPGYRPVTHERAKGPAGAQYISVSAETEDGVFKVAMHVSNSVIFNETVVLSPYEVKVDFIIEDYPYVGGDTQLALLNIIAVANAEWYNGLPEEYTKEWSSAFEEDGWTYDIEGGWGFFSWLKTAEVDGTENPVTSNTLFHFSHFNWSKEGAVNVDLKYVAFTYGRGESIVHDPKIGLAFEGGLPPVLEKLVRGSGGLFLASVAIFAAVVYGSRWARRRAARPQRARGPGGSSPPPQPPRQGVPPATHHVPPPPPHAPPRMPPQGPRAALPQGGGPPRYPPGSPPGGAPPGWQPVHGDPRYGYRPPGQ